ncbi:MAG: excinuclease ABC subunit A [Pedosphaera sp.]|nr:excinuclease ABC subunit A [Pedosphaera sp.]
MPASKPSSSSASSAGFIRLQGVRQNNLKGFDLDLPLGELIVVTGLSGSGKSSLAFETLYAEGQRRYIETFSPYARQFFDRMDKPAVDRIENIPPAIAIEQKNSVRSTRSTVGTMTELCDHMKVLWPQLAQLLCGRCQQPVCPEPPENVWKQVRSAQSDGTDLLVTFKLALSVKMSVAEQIGLLIRQGFQRLLSGDNVVRVEDFMPKIGIEAPIFLTVVVDRIRLNDGARGRFVEACEQAYQFGQGRLAVSVLTSLGGWSSKGGAFSLGRHCAACDIDYPEASPSLFSFNHPLGACASCKGFGRIITLDTDLALPDRSKTLAEGVVRPWQTGQSAECQSDMLRMARRQRVPVDVPFKDLNLEHQQWLMEGDLGYDSHNPEASWPLKWYGVKGFFRWLESKSYKMHVRVLLSRYRSYRICPDCQGKRFKAGSLLYRWRSASDQRGLDLAEFYRLPVRDALQHLETLETTLGTRTTQGVALVVSEVRTRLRYLVEVGLEYLTLDRATRTLSGGETERVNLTTCLGTRLVNTLYVLDEPSVGLHPRDTARLVGLLERLRDLGNTVVVVEHEAAVMRAADQLIDIGPGHGETGGSIVFQGPLSELSTAQGSLTADYLTGRRQIPIPDRRRVALPTVGEKRSIGILEDRMRSAFRVVEPALALLRIQHVSINNLRDVTVEIPLGRFVGVSGVSGSGKTTLIREALLPLLQTALSASRSDDSSDEELEDELAEASGQGLVGMELEGVHHLGAVVLVDQSALGRTPRSNPAVYIGAFDDIRDFFAASEVAKAQGLKAGHFSFNSVLGQCEQCRGAGFEKIEMQFLSDVFIRCPVCQGRRFRAAISVVTLTAPGGRSLSVSDVLELSVDEAVCFLREFSGSKPATRAAEKLALLSEVGLGYLRLGQAINTLSGGESQRLKLVSHLALTPASSPSADSVALLGQRSQPKLKTNSVRLPPVRPTLFLFDEPTTGLHFEDVKTLLAVFYRLVNQGHSVLVIEHNLDVLKCVDWLIDLGPEAGDRGGRVIAAGPPEHVVEVELSKTGQFLAGLISPTLN